MYIQFWNGNDSSNLNRPPYLVLLLGLSLAQRLEFSSRSSSQDFHELSQVDHTRSSIHLAELEASLIPSSLPMFIVGGYCYFFQAI